MFDKKETTQEAALFKRLLSSDKISSLIQGVGIFVKDYVSGICIPNALWKDLGYEADIMSGESWKDLVHPEDRSIVEGFEHLLRAGKADTWCGEYRIKSRAGLYHTIRHKALILERAENGEPQLYVGWDVDVTDYAAQVAEAKRACLAHEQRFRLFEEIRTVGTILSFELDLSRAAERMLTYARRFIPFDAAAVYATHSDTPAPITTIGFESIDPELKSLSRFNYLDQKMANYTPSITTPRGPFASCMRVPLLHRDNIIGYLEFYSMIQNGYGAEEAATVMLFAEYAAIALFNALRYKQTEQEAITDWLTGLLTRRAFMNRASRLIEELPRDSEIAALMIDIDHFKEVNDCFGHAIGDEALAAMATACRNSLRSGDLCCRYGGEEFVVLLPGADVSTALAIAERVRVRTAAIRIDGCPDLRFTVSIGVDVGTNTEDFRELIARADEALYMAKESGRNRCEAR